jgi:hypothetical protein
MLFSFLKRIFSPSKKEAISIESEGDRWLHGMDLEKWNYLGLNRITVVANVDKVGELETGSATVYFFSEFLDDDSRKYIIIDHHPNSGRDYKNHPWILEVAEIWRIGEDALYRPIGENPSRYLQDYMLENYKAVWRERENGRWWWQQTEDAKYTAASTKQKANTAEETKPEVTQTDDEKVITVEFGKKKD